MVTRVTLSLDPIDVELLDRLAALRGLNRSEQFREILGNARPMMRQTVEVLEAALRQRDDFLTTFTQAEILGLEELMPEVHRVQDAVLGAMSRLEGGLAAHEATQSGADDPDADPLAGWESVAPMADSEREAGTADPRGSNHGGHTPTPEHEDTQE